MDERHQQIREGAGLEESKLNVEFIEWLRRWSSPLMMVAAVLAAGYFLYQRYERAQLARVDKAFMELQSALQSGSPEGLKAVASEYDHVRGVPAMANLGAADAFLREGRTGVKSGAVTKPDGTFAPEDLLSDKDRTDRLDQASALYNSVLSATRSEPRDSLYAISAAFGMAAVAESRGQVDEAKKQYETVQKLSETGGYPAQGDIAKKRLETIATVSDSRPLLAKADLPTPPSPPPPPAPTAPTGATLPAEGMTFTPMTPAPGTTGTPAVPVPGGMDPSAPAPTAPSGPPPAPSVPPLSPAPTAPTGSPAPTGAPAPTGSPAPPPSAPK